MSFQGRGTSGRDSERPEVKDDRRRICRSRPLIRDVVLSWRKDDAIVEFPVSLENVSLHGCLAKSRGYPAPKRGESIWFKAPGSGCDDWVEGVLIEARKPFLGKCSIRIKFLAPLPYSSFKY